MSDATESDATETEYVRWFETLGADDTALVGGKNASLGEMIGALREEGVRVPGGFAVTVHAFHAFLDANDLEGEITSLLYAFRQDGQSVEDTGRSLRALFDEAAFPEDVAEALRAAYRRLSARYEAEAVDVAVRSSATAEDLPEASFAGQQETYLNVTGPEALLAACKQCYASLFTDRAISYRTEHGFDHREVALSVGVQKMVRADEAGAGVLFTLDPETGFPGVVLINAGWGLGETVVQGAVTPDQYTVFKPFLDNDHLAPIIGKTLGGKEKKSVYAARDGKRIEEVETSEEERSRFVLKDAEILQLARWGAVIERHYGRPMDIEWAKDGESGDLYVVQARPETVQSRRAAGTLKTYTLKEEGERLLTGLSIGQSVASGRVQVLRSTREIDRFEEGAILVTEKTDPDWVPIMKQAAGIVTNHGGRTSHAAIVSRELGIPAVIGTGRATEALSDGQQVTLSCIEADKGYVYAGLLDYEAAEADLSAVPETETRIMMNIASPAAAIRWWQLPVRGVGLARMEYLINNVIQIHPLALTRFDTVEDEAARAKIEQLTRRYEDKTEYFVDHLARGIATIAAAQHPEPVIVRMSDFKTNEYADLIGGAAFEPSEENPMLGWRGAARYYSEDYRDGFALECQAIRRVREVMGFDNVIIMIPFCRTPEEADRVLAVLAENGLERGATAQGLAPLQVYVMAEVPSNILQADEFAERFDGFSIGSNDLTQLTLGVGRDATRLIYLFDERNRSVKRMIRELIRVAHEAGRKVGICGQAPSDYPDFAAFLVEAGIDSISLNPDSILDAIPQVAGAEQRTGPRGAEVEQAEQEAALHV